MKTIGFLGFLLTILLVAGCEKNGEDPENKEEVQKKKIEQIIPDKYLAVLKDMGMTINEGANPPDVTGIYLASPMRLTNTNIEPDYPIGWLVADYRYQFYAQDVADFSIKMAAKQNSDEIQSDVAVISGSGKAFTVYFPVTRTTDDGEASAIFAYLYSGTLEADGIKDFQLAFINADNSKGGEEFTDEGTGRVFYDEDKFSERISSLNATTQVNTALKSTMIRDWHMPNESKRLHKK